MRTENNADKNKQEQPKIRRGGFRLKKHFPKLSLLLIALVIGFSSVVTLFTPQSASAINTSASKEIDPDWQIRSLILYRALGNCFANNKIQTNPWSGQIDLSAVRSGDWFDYSASGANAKPRVGPYFRGDVDDDNDADVQADCTIPGDIVNPAMSLWGLDKEDFLCNIGAERVSGQKGADCLSQTGASGNFWYGNISVDNYRKYIQKVIYGKEGEEPALSKQAYWYSFYYKVFLNSCAWKRTPLTNPDDIKTLNTTADGTTGYKIKVAQPDGTTNAPQADGTTSEYVYYSGGLTRVHNIATRPGGIESNTNLASVDAHCGNGGNIQIEERINHYAAAAALLMEDGQFPVPNDNTQIIDEEGGSACSVEGGLGWLLCPLANLAAGLTDSLFVAVSAFLRVAPVNLSPNDNPLYSAWATMRTIANVAFVIVFLIIIFSQLSSLGITNYGVKKMLPRLVIAAILVNLSFYICAIAVDVSNIVGVSLQDVFSYISHQTASTVISDTDNWGSITTSVLSGGTVLVAAGVFASILTSGGLLAALAGLLPLLFGSLFALFVAFLVLLARQALIIMAIVVAPLAFVAYLLPNTESWFKKWRDMFITLLALFPMMSIVFGGSQLAAVILRESSASTLDNGEDLIAFFLYIGSFAVQAIPFFITPVLIKLSSGILGRFAGLVNNPNKGPLDRARKWAEGKAENAQNRGYKRKLDARRTHNDDGTERQLSRRRKAFNKVSTLGAGLKSEREKVNESLKNEAKHAETGYISEKTTGSTRLRKRMAGSNDQAAMQRIQARALEAQHSQRAEDAKAGDAILEELNLSGAQRQQLALTGRVGMVDRRTGEPIIDPATGQQQIYEASEALQKAAAIRQMTTGSFAEKKELIEGSAAGGSVSQFAQVIASKAAESQSLAMSDPALAGRRIDDVTQGKFNYDNAVVQAFDEGKYTSEAIAVMHNDARQELLRVAMEQHAAGNPQMLASLGKAVEGIRNSPEIGGKVAGNTAALADLEAIEAGPERVTQLVQGRIKSRQNTAFQTYVDEGNVQGIAPGTTGPPPNVPISTTPATVEANPTSIPTAQTPPPTPPNFFADQQPAAPAPTPPANNDPTSLDYWQSPPPIPADPMRPPTTPPPTDGTNDRDTP